MLLVPNLGNDFVRVCNHLGKIICLPVLWEGKCAQGVRGTIRRLFGQVGAAICTDGQTRTMLQRPYDLPQVDFVLCRLKFLLGGIWVENANKFRCQHEPYPKIVAAGFQKKEVCLKSS